MRISQRLTLLIALLGCEDGQRRVEADLPADASVDAVVDVEVVPEPADAAPDLPRDAASDLPLDAAPDRPDLEPSKCPPVTPEEAPLIEPGEPVEDDLCANRSAWYRVASPPGTSVSARLSFSHRRGDLELRLHGPEGPIDVSESATDEERVGAAADQLGGEALIEIYGYEGAEGPYTLEVWRFDEDQAEPRQVEGSLHYEDRAYDPGGFTGERVPRPGRGVVVQIVRASDGIAIAESLTDAAGAFALEFRAHPEPHRVRAISEVRHAGFVVKTTGGDTLHYAVEAPLPEEGPVALLASADDAIGGALNIVDSVYDAFALIAPYAAEPSPPLTYRWSPGVANGCGSCYVGNRIELGGQLEDPDEWDDVIILHEFGHYFVHHFSHDDSPAGPHRDMLVDPLLAYGEGVAYFFAALVKQDPHVVDTFFGEDLRSIDIEAVEMLEGEPDPLSGTHDGSQGGRLREELVAGVLWDSYDPPNEAHDTLELGVEAVMQLLTATFAEAPNPDSGPRGMDLSDWLHALTCEVEPPAVAALAEEREFPWAPTRCEKTRHPTPYAIVARDGLLWLTGEAKGAHLVHRRSASGWHSAPLCAGCSLGPAAGSVVVTTPGAPWAGASWLDTEARGRLLGGLVKGPARNYPSR